MKFALRVKFAVIGAVLMAMLLSGAAFADVSEVAQIIQGYGLTATVSGNAITVTGNITNSERNGLDIGDISGLTVLWKATLKSQVSITDNQPISLVKMGAESSEGVFKIADDGKISLTVEGKNIAWPREINTTGNVHVIIDNGGTVELIHEDGDAIARSEDGGKITLNSGGTINAPHCTAIDFRYDSVVLNDTANLTGAVSYKGQNNILVSDIYGNFSIIGGEMSDWSKSNGLELTVKSGATFTITTPIKNASNANIAVEQGGKIIVPKGVEWIWNGIMSISGTTSSQSSNSVGIVAATDVGVLENNGTFLVSSTGKIVNDGKINNNGTMKSDPANITGNGEITGNKVEPISGNTGGGGGGCNAGIFAPFGVFAILIPLMFKKRK